jgi:hypothetical protein
MPPCGGGHVKALALVFALATAPAGAAERVASFGFELVNTSLEPTQPAEEARLAALDQQLADAFTERGYSLVDVAPAAEQRAGTAALRDCPACEVEMARQLGADLAVLGWVQKVSNLILNVNVQLHDVASGKLLRAASADIRGNTDESWRHGLRWLIRNRIFAKDQPGHSG